MKKCRLWGVLFMLMVAVSLMAALPLVAAAEPGDAEEDDSLDDILIPIPVVTTPEPAPVSEPQAFTPDGNLSLVDDFYTVRAIETVEEKQFITVETKNGNFFYIVIDRAGDEDNVYFLNLVDELDLYALLDEDAGVPEPSPSPPPEPLVPLQTVEIEPVPEPEGGNGGVIALIVFVVLAAAGAAVYFKVLRPKQASYRGGTAVLSDAEFEDEDDDGYAEDGEVDGDDDG